MQWEAMEFLKRVRHARPKHFGGVRVLEIGSRNVNGSARELFADCEYVGTDRKAGKGVDVVMHGEDLDYPNDSFDVALSTESFEHTLRWPTIMENMRRMLKPGGLLIVTTAAFDYKKHGPRDGPTYRNLQPYDLVEWRKTALMYEEDRHSNHIMLAWEKPLEARNRGH